MIFMWWRTHKRDLPWRHTRDPYKILVSEVMLQQTQVSRVLPKYKEFLKQFPTLPSLGKASTTDVLRAWKGLGYNRRAVYLKKITHIPNSEAELIKLPGIGKYTARAILVFAFKQDIAMVDTNIRQIITHFFFHDKSQKEKKIQEVADQLLPIGKSWEWHQALMDYGAMELQGTGYRAQGLVKKQKKFIGSNRYYRGRLMDLLREKSFSEIYIKKKFSQPVIDGLLKDGLIVRNKRMLSLPD